MATTYELIKGETLASSAATYSFTAIPSTYTDIVVAMSAKSTDTATETSGSIVRFNGANTGSLVSTISLRWTSSSAAPYSTTLSNDNEIWPFTVPTSNALFTNVFNTAEIYIPNYTVAQNKPMSFVSIAEQNNTTGYGLGTVASGLRRSTDAITSLTFYPYAGNWEVGSSFYLYGIKKN